MALLIPETDRPTGVSPDALAMPGGPRTGVRNAERRPIMHAGVWPTPDQELLLRGAFAREAVPGCQWLERTDIDRIDGGSFQLLPQLYRNLTGLGATAPVIQRLRGVYRYAWSVNCVALRQARLHLECLADAGVTARVIGPAAFLQRYYGDLGARVVDGLQLLVRPRDVRRSLAALQEAGLAPALSIDVDRLLATADSANLTMTGERPVFLHWSLFGAQSGEEDDRAEQQQIEVDGSPAACLSATDDLLFVLVRATRWDVVPPFRWLGDGMAILNSPQAHVDWDRLLHRARALRVVLPIRHALGHLQDRLGQSVPPRVLRAAESQPVSLGEHVAFRVRYHPPGMLGRLPELLVRYLERSRGVVPVRRAVGLLTWLREAWALPSLAAIPGFVVRRGSERLRKAAGARRVSTNS